MSDEMKPFKPEISASAVAALIGMNPYRKPHEVMYSVLQKNKALKETIRRLETQHRRVPIEVMQRNLANDNEIRKILSDGLEATKTNTDIRGIVENAASQIGVVGALRQSSIPLENRDSMFREVASQIHKQRGLRNENQILDDHEKEAKVVVTDRNTRMVRKDYGQFILLGRIDGQVASQNRIVDSKERTQFRNEVPLQDEVQMRVYMDLIGAVEAELLERFPDKNTRKTVFTNDSNKQGAILAALRTASADMIEAVADESKLMRIIEANTFTLTEPTPVKSELNAGVIGINYIV